MGKCVGYATSNPTVPFIDACALPGAVTVLQSQSSWAHTNYITFPGSFTFDFYGAAVTQFWLQSQATIGIGQDMLTFPFGFGMVDGFPDCSGGGDPTTAYPAAVLFGDQEMATGPLGVCYAVTTGAGDAGVGDAATTDASHEGGAGDGGVPGAKFVATWKQVTLFTDPGSSLDISVVLTQGTDTIDFQYQVNDGVDGGPDAGASTTLAGANATVGIQQGNGSAQHTATSCDMPFIPASPYDIRYTP